MGNGRYPIQEGHIRIVKLRQLDVNSAKVLYEHRIFIRKVMGKLNLDIVGTFKINEDLENRADCVEPVSMGETKKGGYIDCDFYVPLRHKKQRLRFFLPKADYRLFMEWERGFCGQGT